MKLSKLIFILLLLNMQNQKKKSNYFFFNYFFFNYFKFFFLKKVYIFNVNNIFNLYLKNKESDYFLNNFNFSSNWFYVLNFLNTHNNSLLKFYPSNYYLNNIYIYFNLFFNLKNKSIHSNNFNKICINLNNFFLRKFIEIFFNKKCFLKFNKYDLSTLDMNVIYLNLYKRLKKMQIFNKSKSLLKEFLEISLLLVYTKDLRLFKNWVIKVSENMHFKLHRKFFYIFKIVFQKYFLLYGKDFGCLGFYFKVKGKIGLGGNSKKKRNIIKIGKFSLTTKKLKIKYDQGQIRTYSGTLGVEFLISYI